MARFFGPLILLIAVAASGYGQTPTPTPTPTPQPAAAVKTPVATAQPSASVKLEDLRRSIEQLTPEQQQKVLQNLHRWLALSPDERDVLRQRQRVRQQKEEESVTEAYQKSGLRLNEEGREIFRKLYLQERRKLEEQLAKDTQEKRQKGDATIVEKLKKELANSPNASATSTQR
ncbi:MAG TPA: hypothetical protein VN957_23550 [Chthoniobacterales bacterium]|jgi:hypothetical protein|nr:hypothetical protein [Chthoniobacterales bacterium]